MILVSISFCYPIIYISYYDNSNIYLYFFIFIVLYYVSGFIYYLMLWYLSFIYAYVVLCTFMMIHRHEHIYFMHLPMLSSGTCFQLSIPFMAPMLLYFYMIHISLQPPALALVLSIYKKYIPFICLFLSLGVYSTGARYA